MRQHLVNSIDCIIMQCSKIKASFYFACKHHLMSILLTVVFLFIFIYDLMHHWEVATDFKKIWNDNINQIVSLATLSVALCVWWSKVVEDWKSNLPKRFTIICQMLDDNNQYKTVMECIDAHLSHEADIRNLGQQIAMHMNCNQRIHFQAPLIEYGKKEILYGGNKGHFVHYTVIFTLTETPVDLPSGKYKIWQAPFGIRDLQILDQGSC